MPNPIRVVVPIDSMDPESWNYAVGYVQKIASEASPAVTDVILLTHTKDVLTRSSLAGFIGAAPAKALAKGTRVGFGSGATLRHETLRTLGYSARNAVVIAFYADDAMLEKIDGLRDLTAVVAVPDFEDSIDKWRHRWNPNVHGEAQAPAAPLIADPVVVKALETITALCNMSHGMLIQRDKDHASENLRILRAKGHALDAETIKSWAISKGWHPGAADDLGKVADKISRLKTKPSISGFYEPEARYARWKS
ncbi:hypothetical protein [Sphingomonas prati]|uniref:Uncharacterized protein n=1 Tax=Sphingomonas prati TaxID=1843237 RepID=A0A7W9F4Z0_9SPHN|nr:hypothetical protein [Sphingomonas prati]MBB5730970.1 hypothetical protein [Sphingomonas prati]GGE98144.1 hypothetical protein GCM10011404_34120 [Sphingomonas prati]